MTKQWNERFVAMSPREKYLIAGATLVCVLLLGFTFLVEPVAKQKSQLNVALVSEKARVNNLQQQVALFSEALKDDPDTPLKAQIARLEQRQHELGIQFADELSDLVDPAQMPAVMKRLFNRAGRLSLQEMRSLPVENLFKDDPQMQGTVLYEHGLILTFTGNYFAVRNFLREVEQGEDALYWRTMRYEVDDYPQALVTLQIYTLSTDEAFIRVN